MTKVSSYTIDIFDLINFKYELLSSRGGVEIRRMPKGPTIKVRRKFHIDKEFAWIAGFYFAEGSKMKACVGVSNSFIKFLLRFRKYLENTFNLKKYRWFVLVHTSKITEDKLKYFEEIFGGKPSVYFSTLARVDTVEIRICNVIIADIFHSMLEKSLEIIQSDNVLTLEFLKGYEVGDGSMNVRNGCLHDINITVRDEKMKNILKSMFKQLYGINFNERKTNGSYEIFYCNVKGIIDIVLDGHFREYDRQWLKLINSYKNKEYIRSHLRYWAIINKPKSIESIAKRSNRSHWSVREALGADAKLGLVEAYGRKISESGHTYKFYNLTEKGKHLVKVLSE